MRIIRQASPLDSPGVLAIGHLDGVHIGHQALLQRLHDQKKHWNLPSRLLTFYQDPLALWGRAPQQLMRLADRLRYIAQWDVDTVICLPFSRQWANLSGQAFVEHYLKRCWKTRVVVVGHDFRFGAARAADVALLQEWGRQGGEQAFAVDVLPEVCDPRTGHRVSSTAIREALLRDDLCTVQRLMGRPYTVTSRVSRGAQQGRVLGFPTLNMPWPAWIPFSGVFVVSARPVSEGFGSGVGNPWRAAVANVGVRPTVESGGRAQLEVHLLHWDGDTYGAEYGSRWEVAFWQKIRNEQQFSGVPQLVAQIAEDTHTAARWHAQNFSQETQGVTEYYVN